MRFFGSTGEPDGRGEGIWGGGLVISHRSGKSERSPGSYRWANSGPAGRARVGCELELP